MLYKEWKTVRIKFFLWVAVYLGAGVIFIIEEGGYNLGHNFSVPLFEQWQGISALTMTLGAALGGIDLVADEKANGTLSFLLTKPISRTQIYLSKLGVNIIALAVAFLPVNLLMLAIDRFNPTGISEQGRSSEACLQHLIEECSRKIQATTQASDLLQGIAVIGLILLFGTSIICLTGLVSIFARNTMQAILFTMPALAAFVGMVAASLVRAGPSGMVGIGYFYSVSIVTPLIVLWVGGSFFYVGLYFFKTKEF